MGAEVNSRQSRNHHTALTSDPIMPSADSLSARSDLALERGLSDYMNEINQKAIDINETCSNSTFDSDTAENITHRGENLTRNLRSFVALYKRIEKEGLTDKVSLVEQARLINGELQSLTLLISNNSNSGHSSNGISLSLPVIEKDALNELGKISQEANIAVGKKERAFAIATKVLTYEVAQASLAKQIGSLKSTLDNATAALVKLMRSGLNRQDQLEYTLKREIVNLEQAIERLQEEQLALNTSSVGALTGISS